MRHFSLRHFAGIIILGCPLCHSCPLFIGGLDKLTGGDEKKEGEGEKTETGEDPEVVQARLEQEERRKEKHRKMEMEREKMRQDIRDKVSRNTLVLPLNRNQPHLNMNFPKAIEPI